MHESIVFSPLRKIYSMLRSCELKAVDLARAAVDFFAARGAQDHAYLTWSGDSALKTAEAVDAVLAACHDAGPLMGIPVSIKDLYGMPGFATYAGSPRKLPAKWEQAGPLVEKLLYQLPVVMGKTHTVEFAFGGLGTNSHWGTPRNPWDSVHHRIPGGSSSGAGVSLVSGTACLALGTDTAGSSRIPAAMTGVAGLKTTAGRWSTRGIVPLSCTLDTPGLLARTVDDLAFAFDSLDEKASKGFNATAALPKISDLTFGVPEAFFWNDCSPGIAETVRDAIRQIEAAGATIICIDLPDTDEAYALFKEGGLAAAEVAAFLKTEMPDWIDLLDPDVRARIKAADNTPAWEYIRRRHVLKSMAVEAKKCLEDVDALLTPTVVITPPTLESLAPEGAYSKANMLALRNTMICNFMGLCALTLPVGVDALSMPVGMQVIAKPWEDRQLLAIGQTIELEIGNGLEILGEPPMPI